MCSSSPTWSSCHMVWSTQTAIAGVALWRVCSKAWKRRSYRERRPILRMTRRAKTDLGHGNCCNTANTGVKVNFYCKKVWECLVIRQNVCIFASQLRKNGALSERLGTGLQNHSRRFDSATHLKAKAKSCLWFRFFRVCPILSYPTINKCICFNVNW